MPRQRRLTGCARPYLRAIVLGMCLLSLALAPAFGGQAGQFTIRAKGRAAAQTLPDFHPVAGRILHLQSVEAATAKAEWQTAPLQPPYEVSGWVYLAGASYDDLILYRARDDKGEPTDVTVMLREHASKMPDSPDDWHGALWVEDAEGCRSVASVRRPAWNKICVARKSEQEVTVLVNGEAAGSFRARSARPAARIEVGDFSASDGSGEAYWGGMVVSVGQGPTAKQLSVEPWELSATGGGTAEQGLGFDEARRAHLYLQSAEGTSCEAEWGTVRMEVPYQFWCQVYVSEEPYRNFNLICPLDGEGNPTDLQVELDDGEQQAGGEASPVGFVWVIDAEGRHNVGSIARGAWHELTIRRRKERTVDLLIDGVPVKSCPSRSSKPVASYRFGDFSSESSVGEAYWYKIRLVHVPKE